MPNINPIRIPGNWQQGFALDYHTLHSHFVGHDEFGHPIFDTERSEIGELLYKLKYKSDRSAADEIVEAAAGFVLQWKIKPDLIVPVPPSKRRNFQPILLLAHGLAAKLKVPLCLDCVTKVKGTPEVKNIYEYDKRIAALENAFNVKKSKVQGQTILLFDDLFRSGATMDALTKALNQQGEVANVYALAVTKTRSTL